MSPIFDTLYTEVSEVRVKSVEGGLAAQQLRVDAARTPLNSTQSHLLEETVACLEGGAYRASVVIVWNLAYDFFRQWIYDKHLRVFNESLVSGYLKKSGEPQYKPIEDYDDFYRGKPGERTVIDVSESAGAIGEKVADTLRHYLRRRNDYAHPSFLSPNHEQAHAYARDLLELIRLPPFNRGATSS